MIFYVDIPIHPDRQSQEQEYQAVAQFPTKEEAVSYCKEHFGADDDGRVLLISGG